jgi:CheY-like chemotaxis protein
MNSQFATEPLTALERLLDDLQRLAQVKAAEGLDSSVGAYVEDAIEAAMAAAGRARDNDVQGAASQIGDTVSVARALLADLAEPLATARALVSRSMDLRRQAVRLTAAALTLRRRAPPLGAAEPPPIRTAGDPLGAMLGVRVLLVGGDAAQEQDLTRQLASLGAEVCAVRSLATAVEAGRGFRPDVLLCDVPFPAAEGLVCELRRQGVIAPALAAAAADDTGTQGAARAAGFTGVLLRPIEPAALTRAVRAALGA